MSELARDELVRRADTDCSDRVEVPRVMDTMMRKPERLQSIAKVAKLRLLLSPRKRLTFKAYYYYYYYY